MTYSYKCFHCGYEFERNHAVDNRYLPLSESCPQCGADRSIQKLVTSVPFKVKGASAKNGYSTMVGDVEKFTGKPYQAED
jgi:putative FmdB family regulatory protein